MTQDVTSDRRKQIFLALVSSQDEGASVLDSRANIAAQFELAVDDVLAIERAGISEKWPPLTTVDVNG